ncbi:anaphase-promoting complex subunit 11 [Quercus suber]|uniref:Anaphase-promoting complex subunit 11 n=1 Tax=Quercus suber TaxID=58331 RepID=A0AAW0L5R5_QUESU
MAFDGCCPDCKLPGDDCPLNNYHGILCWPYYGVLHIVSSAQPAD